MRTTRVAGIFAAAATLLLQATAPPALGQAIDRQGYADKYEYGYGDCGYPVHVVGTASGQLSVRTGKGRDESAYFFTNAFMFEEVHTRTDTGERFIVKGRGLVKDVKATRLEGDVFRFETFVAGQPYEIRDADGRVVLRDRGVLRFTYTVDTAGDHDPGSEFLELIDVDSSGPHPVSSADFCEVAGDLVGTGSAARLSQRPVGTTSSPLGYYEYLPPGYGEAPSPLLVFLHGYGETGDGSAQELPQLLATGVPRLVAINGWPTDRPFVVLSPQHDFPTDASAYAPCESAPEQGGSCAMRVQHDLGHPHEASACTTPQEVGEFLQFALDHYQVDPSRIYLTGLSCGGFATWEYLAQGLGPEVAAAVPIAAEGRPAWNTAGCELGDAAIWTFHGDADDLVSPDGSIQPMTNLAQCPSPPRQDARLTVYQGVDHDSWSSTYDLTAGHDIYEWLLATVRVNLTDSAQPTQGAR